MRTTTILATALCLTFPGALCRAAVPIPNLFNTGVDEFGALLPDGVIDPHYMLVDTPPAFPGGPGTFVADSTKFPFGDPVFFWIPNGPESKWIAPDADQSLSLDSLYTGSFIYRTTFDLTGLSPASAILLGRWSTDNPGVDILLNGASTGFSHPDAGVPSFQYFGDFLIDDGFRDGVNTLDFALRNSSLGFEGINPSGLRVEISGSADLIPVPEGATILAGCTLLMAIAMASRSKQRAD